MFWYFDIFLVSVTPSMTLFVHIFFKKTSHVVKSINFRNVIYYIFQSWESVQSLHIYKASNLISTPQTLHGMSHNDLHFYVLNTAVLGIFCICAIGDFVRLAGAIYLPWRLFKRQRTHWRKKHYTYLSSMIWWRLAYLYYLFMHNFIVRV